MDEWIQVSDITQFFYCPRKVYFRRVLGLEIAPRPKMELGREEHEKEHERVEHRKNVYGIKREEISKICHDLMIESEKLGLYGKIDSVVFLESGEIIPVELKYTHTPEVIRNWRKQLTAYALLLEDKYNTRVRRGIFYFQQQKKVVEVEITHQDK